MKPIATGVIQCRSGRLISQDAEMLVKFSAVRDPWEWVNPYALASSAVPAVAAKLEKSPILLERILECFQHLSAAHDFIVAEGAGGVMTPLAENLAIRDLIKLLGIPAIVVTRAGRNAVNQALMTLQCLKHQGVETLGFFINRFPPKPNLSETTCAELIASSSGALCLGTIPDMGDTFSQQQLIQTFENSLNKDAFEEAFG
jgi:dethiobiotin synthetase